LFKNWTLKGKKYLDNFTFLLQVSRKAIGSCDFEVIIGDCRCPFFLYKYLSTASVVYWSEFLATDPEARVRFPALPKKKVVGHERGPLSLVSTTEELLDRKVAAPV
jgi:hypothetical protein